MKKEKKEKKTAKKNNPVIKSVKKKYRKNKVFVPKTNQQLMSMMFDEISQNIMRIDDDTYSICFEYTDISFAKADAEDAGAIFLKWVDYLNSFTKNTHIQVTNASTPINTEKYKKDFVYDESQLLDENEKEIAREFNTLIDHAIGTNRNTLITKRYITVSQHAMNFDDAKSIFFNIYRRTEEKFKDLKSDIRIVPMDERLTLLHDFWNIQTADEKNMHDILGYAKENDLTIYDVLAPKEYINVTNTDYLEITPQDIANSDAEETKHKKKFIRCLYIDPDFPNAITPRFYNTLTTIQDVNMITTINIQPTETVKAVKRLNKLQSGLETERFGKIKSLAKQQLNYEYMKDKKLEGKLEDVGQMIEDIQYNDQKMFYENIVVCILADSYEELEDNTVKVQNKVGEMLIKLAPLLWQQIEGIVNTLPLGHNTLQFQHQETSEATGVHVPFNSKDFQHPQSLYYGINLVSRNPIFLERKRLMNGNGAVLATSGSGKSFSMKTLIEQILIRYPKDEVVVIDFQKEYDNLIEWFHGQKIVISSSTDTHINPLDLDQNYNLSETENDSPVKAKIEYIQGWVESIVDEGNLDPVEKTVIDRCVRNVFWDYELSHFKDKSKQPLLKDFQIELEKQPEDEAKRLAKSLERFVEGSQDIFAYPTNVNIHNRVIGFDISELPQSMQTAGYLVILDHIMNRLVTNRNRGIDTWIFIDEFHILLKNASAGEYVAKLIKIGRKYNALMTVITQNIEDVLNNEQGRKILNNTEFALILKQKSIDRALVCNQFEISENESRYIANDAKSGQGIIVYGHDKIPFQNLVPNEFKIYELNNTDKMATTRG